MKTLFLKKHDNIEMKWHVVDARGQVLGRLASRVARILAGRTEPDYTPHVDSRQGVIVINSKEARVTGTKEKTKIYTSFSGYPSGIDRKSYERVMREDPTFAIKHAVKGMLPKNRLGKRMITRLLVYAGAEHPHIAQKPKNLKKEKE